MQALESYTLDNESYQQLICYLDTLTPFEAIRQAEEINKMNGFEVVNRVEVGKWKKSVKAFLKNQNHSRQSRKIKIGFSQKEIVKNDFQNIKSQKLNVGNGKRSIKMSDYQKAFMKLLN